MGITQKLLKRIRIKLNMSIKFLFIFALSFVLAWSENLPENQVLESENTQTFENIDISENAVSVSEKDKIKLDDLLFEYLELGNNFANGEKDDSESEPAVVVEPRKMHKEFYKKLFDYFQQENLKEKTQEENNKNADVEIKALVSDCNKQTETKRTKKFFDEPLVDEQSVEKPLVEDKLVKEPLIEDQLIEEPLKDNDTLLLIE